MSEMPAGLAGVQHHSLCIVRVHFTPGGFCFPNGSGTTDFTVPEGAQDCFSWKQQICADEMERQS